ncbi:unnamed protein product [Cyclocybe aegerita]|uniref:GST N-terminal domain-containing protein n=1 Tax=Cyclocybe aegerita TaxID=1973307 RepID=A0A8S0W4W5_CYCAE|nr:unnamed protein product [Cyclocybe aegerita]
MFHIHCHRYSLNFKGIPYRTEWIQYVDIEAHAIEHEIPPSSKKPDGKPHYTLPAIYDESTGVKLSDSLVIADYLEKTYPNTPPLFPNNTRALQGAFEPPVFANMSAVAQFSLPYLVSGKFFTQRGEKHYRTLREPGFGQRLEDILPVGEARVREWERFKNDVGDIASWYDKNGSKGPFVLGEAPSWADFVVASYLVWLRVIWGEESEEWKDLEAWHNGRWKNLFIAIRKYEKIV